MVGDETCDIVEVDEDVECQCGCGISQSDCTERQVELFYMDVAIKNLLL